MSGLSCMSILDDKEVAHLVAFIFGVLTQQPSSTSTIVRNQYQAAHLANEDIDLMSLAKLFDADRCKCPTELLFTPASLRYQQQHCRKGQKPDQQGSKTELKVQNTSELDRRMDSECKTDPQLDIPSKPWQADCDDIVQKLGEELQYLRSEMGKMSARVTYLETHIKQLKQSHDSVISRAHTVGSQGLEDIEQMDQHGFRTDSAGTLHHNISS